MPDIQPLPKERCVPTAQDIIGWTRSEMPPWYQKAFPSGVFNTLNTKSLQSKASLERMGEFIKEHLVEKTKDGKGPLIDAEGVYVFKTNPVLDKQQRDEYKKHHKEIKRFNYVPKKNGLPRALKSTERCQVMGFQKMHLDGFGNLSQELSTPDGAQMIGDSFDVPTMAHVLAPLKSLQEVGVVHSLGPPVGEGITVLSLFDGMSGAAAALSAAGVKVARVIIVELEAKRIEVSRCAWSHLFPGVTKEAGTLVEHQGSIEDLVQKVVTLQYIRDLVLKKQNGISGIDLVIGGSPCKQISGFSRRCALGLSGPDSQLFFTFSHILGWVVDAYKELAIDRERSDLKEQLAEALEKRTGVNSNRMHSYETSSSLTKRNQRQLEQADGSKQQQNA
eukprot:CAMPEP_0198204642 /NCGR_PEP_ID=MMETSP1445-20131203/8063_1 /TAXON_ID=36898 /ORGANISM="Pyramimonas sp., Strain CCMP2087" /LENGTH=389 /DNA_ID=CAMNT_0043876609 /DNA_START=190 /DNA_END=1360 /DNA_ORIENTATION=+